MKLPGILAAETPNFMETMTAPIILIADRNDDVLNYFRKETATTDCALVHAKDGEEVLAILGSQAPHIAAAVIELELPVVNGLDLIGRLTSLEPSKRKLSHHVP
jgi:CheY-like chemotaxis protein